MAMYDFMAFYEDFKKLPPLFEVGRAYISMPGDKGYNSVDAETKRKGLKGVRKSAGRAPEWFKRGYERLSKMRETVKKPNG